MKFGNSVTEVIQRIAAGSTTQTGAGGPDATLSVSRVAATGSPSVRGSGTARRPRVDRWLIATVAMAAVFVGVNAGWLWINRRGGAVNIDEAGYIALSVNDYHVLTHEGLRAFIRFLAGQPVQPPLVTVLGALLYPFVGGPSILGSYVVEYLAYFWSVIVVFMIVRGLSGARAGLVSAFLAGSTPIALDYVHQYSFAMPATAMLATAAWAALRSQQMTSLSWAAVWGGALGAMVLSRSMTIAFLSGFLVVAIIQVFVSRRWVRALTGVAVGGVAGFVIAGPWYLVQGGSVWAYLTSFGFGAQSARYGAARSTLSLASWIGFVHDNVNPYLWLPLALILFAGGVVLASHGVASVCRAWPDNLRTAWSSPWLHLSLIVIGGAVALESSRNTGSAFLLPLTPLVVALGVGALFRWVGRSAWQAALISAVAVIVGASIWTAKTALNGPHGALLSVSLPGIDRTTVIDGRSEFDTYEAGQIDSADPAGTHWVAVNRALVSRIRTLTQHADPAPVVVFATNDRMLNINTFRLDEALDGGPEFDTVLLSTSLHNDARDYVAQLRASRAGGVLVILRLASTGEFAPVINATAVLRAAQSLQLHQVAEMPLPDGTSVQVWRR